MIDIEELKPQIIERLESLNPDKIILFGSYAKGIAKQEIALRMQIRLARKFNLPLIIHNREAHDDILNILSIAISFFESWNFVF